MGGAGGTAGFLQSQLCKFTLFRYLDVIEFRHNLYCTLLFLKEILLYTFEKESNKKS